MDSIKNRTGDWFFGVVALAEEAPLSGTYTKPFIKPYRSFFSDWNDYKIKGLKEGSMCVLEEGFIVIFNTSIKHKTMFFYELIIHVY